MRYTSPRHLTNGWLRGLRCRVDREGTNAAPRWRRGRGALPRLSLAMALLATGVLSALFEAERVVVLQPYNIDATSNARYLYEVAAPTFPFAFVKEAVDGGQEARLELKEDGSKLGPRLGVEYRAASVIEWEIGEAGKGRYAFERGVLQFSASDNSDPRRNGRFYHLVYAIAVAPAARFLLILAAAAALLSSLANAKRGARAGSPSQ